MMNPSKKDINASSPKKKHLTKKEIAELGKRIDSGDETASFDLMREACETENWPLLESCVREHNSRAPQSPRPYIYLAFAYARLGRQLESNELLNLGYERSASASLYTKEMAVVSGVFGRSDQAQLYFALHQLLASDSGDDKARARLREFGKAFVAFLKENNIDPDAGQWPARTR